MVNLLNLPDWNVTSATESPDLVEAEATYGPQPTACLQCGTVGRFFKHGTVKQSVRDVPSLGRPCVVRLTRQRYRCRECDQTFSQAVEELDARGTMTRRLVAYIQRESVDRTYSDVARAVGVTVGTVRNVFEESIKALDERVRFVTPRVLGIDEIHILGKFCCVMTNVFNKSLVDILPTRTQAAVFQRLMRLEDRAYVEVVTIDMHRPYRDAVREALPKAVVVVDKFHVVRMANAAMESVRLQIRAGLSPKARKGLMHDKHVLRKREADLSESQRLKLEAWVGQYPDLAAAHAAKERFYGIWDALDEADARARWAAWKAELPPQFAGAWKDVLTAMANWETEIFAYFSHRYTNAYTESLNGLTRSMHRLGRGYSFEAIRAKMLYSKGTHHKPLQPRPRLMDQLSLAFIHEFGQLLDVVREADGSYGAHLPTFWRKVGLEDDSTADCE